MTKYLFTSLLALFFLAGTANLTAQRAERGDRPERTPEEIAEKATERLARHLDLTEEQRKKIEAINLEFARKAAAAREELAAERAAIRERMGAVREEHDAAVEAVLTPEQRAERKELQEKAKQRMQERREGRGDRGRRGGRGRN